MMKNTIIVMSALVFLIVGQAWASQVTNVSLQYQDGQTLARIEADGSVRFTHQTEEAKDGKPFRVIVDILAATHRLPAKDFLAVPNCPVQHIRTSQFAVKPEQVVRVVFDMEDQTVYRVESNKEAITVFFPDKQNRQFANWSAAASVTESQPVPPSSVSETPAVAAKSSQPGKTDTEINKAIDEDRQLSLSGEPSPPTKVSTPTGDKSKESLTDIKTQVEAQKSTVSTEERLPSVSEKPTSTAQSVESASLKTNQEKTGQKEQQEPSQPMEAKKTEDKPKAPIPIPIVTAEKNTSTPSAPEQQPITGKGTEDETVKTPQKATEPDKDIGKQDSTDLSKDQEPDAEQRSTARFRRSPTSPTKIKGTLVAEFPQRLVIKYKTQGYRDPFETLINESKTYNNPIEGRIPNVEGLKLVGVLESESGINSALFEDTDGYGYILQEGDQVQNGYVLRIEHDLVYFQIFEYGWSRTVALNMEED